MVYSSINITATANTEDSKEWSRGRKVFGFLRYYKTILIIVIPALLLLPLPLVVPGKESRAGYILLLMAVYWCTEVLPLGITGLMPIFMVPLFGITKAKEVCNSYMEDTTVMLMGGLIMAIAVEKSNLHRRIAIKVLMTIGGTPRWLLLGFMVPTWFLSMWISNTATTAMMMPIVDEVLHSLDHMNEEHEMKTIEKEKEDGSANPVKFYIDTGLDNAEETEEQRTAPSAQFTQLAADQDLGDAAVAHIMSDQADQRIASTAQIIVDQPSAAESRSRKSTYLGKALTISVAYAANAGGTATLIGTGVNPILKGQADELWLKNGCEESPINFVSWMVMGLPISFINLFVIWIWLEIFFIGFREFCGKASEEDKAQEVVVKQILNNEYRKLGPMSVCEIETTILFLVLVLLWFFRDPGFIPGWDSWFNDYTSDATPAIFMVVILFVVPESYRLYADYTAESIVTWKSMKEKFPWDVVLLLGGGFALADATLDSGLSDWLGKQLTVLDVLPEVLLVIILGILVTIITQFTSNVASASLMLPIVASMSENMGKNPLFLMWPVAISVQYAFMLPVATPPNAVAFTTGRITVLDMVKAGSFLNVACVLVMTLGNFTWGMAYFDLNTIPWDACVNATSNNALVSIA